MQKKHLNIKRQHSSTEANKSKNKNSQQHNDIKEKESQQRSDVSDYQESPHQSDIKEVIVDRLDQHQNVFNVTSSEIKIINSSPQIVQFTKHIGARNHIDHLMSDNIDSEFRSIDNVIKSVQDNFTNKRYITSKNYIEKIAQDNFDITLHIKNCVKSYNIRFKESIDIMNENTTSKIGKAKSTSSKSTMIKLGTTTTSMNKSTMAAEWLLQLCNLRS